MIDRHTEELRPANTSRTSGLRPAPTPSPKPPTASSIPDGFWITPGSYSPNQVDGTKRGNVGQSHQPPSYNLLRADVSFVMLQPEANGLAAVTVCDLDNTRLGWS